MTVGSELNFSFRAFSTNSVSHTWYRTSSNLNPGHTKFKCKCMIIVLAWELRISSLLNFSTRHSTKLINSSLYFPFPWEDWDWVHFKLRLGLCSTHIVQVSFPPIPMDADIVASSIWSKASVQRLPLNILHCQSRDTVIFLLAYCQFRVLWVPSWMPCDNSVTLRDRNKEWVILEWQVLRNEHTSLLPFFPTQR